MLFALQKDTLDDASLDNSSVSAGGSKTAPADKDASSVTSKGAKKAKDAPDDASAAPSVASRESAKREAAPSVEEVAVSWRSAASQAMQYRRGEGAETPQRELFAVTSGVLLFTGNGYRAKEPAHPLEQSPLEADTGAADDNNESLGLDSCFVALYNPKETGGLACYAEVNVCGYAAAPGHTAQLDPALGPFCVFPSIDDSGSVSSRPGRRRDVVAAVHTTPSSGHELVVRLADAETGDQLYEAGFIVPPPPPPPDRVSSADLVSVVSEPGKES